MALGRLSAIFLATGLLFTGLGCSKADFSQVVDKTKQTISDGAGKVKQEVVGGVEKVRGDAKEQLRMAGSAEVDLDGTSTTPACYAHFLPQGGGRPSVLQLRSYREMASIAYPALFLQAQVAAGGASELVGQTVSAKFFFQSDEKAPVWFSPPGTHVELRIVAADAGSVAAEFSGGSVQNSESGAVRPVKGSVSAVVP